MRYAQFMAKPIHEALLQILLFGASAPVALGATHYVCPRQTAEEQSAAFALISELLDANALDYVGRPTGVWSRKDNTFLPIIDLFDTVY